MKPVHLTELQGKLWQEKKISHALEFLPNGTFGAFYASEKYLKEMGYCVGSMCGKEPIGFMHNFDYVAKWTNLSREDKAQLDGVIIPNEEFREGGAVILFFNPPKY